MLQLSFASTRNPSVCLELNGTANLLTADIKSVKQLNNPRSGSGILEIIKKKKNTQTKTKKTPTVWEVVVLLMLCAAGL